MKKYEPVDINIMSSEQRSDFLLALLPHIKKYSSISGGEGTAYFVGDKLIVKEFDKAKDKVLLDSIFEAYAEESKKFAEMGYAVPQIYAWAKVDSKKSLFSNETVKRFYILEEQIKGRELFLSKLSSVYDQIRCDITKREYDRAIQDPMRYPAIYKQIIKEYINDFITVNAYIESLSDSQMESFIDSMYQMFKQAKYSIPDIHKKNVFMTDDGLKIIDNYMAIKCEHDYFSRMSPENFLATMLVILFKPNESVNDMFKKSKIDSSMVDEFQILIGENRMVCSAAIEKVLLAMRRYLNGKDIEHQRILHTAYQRLSRILDYNRAAELISIMNKNYLGM